MHLAPEPASAGAGRRFVAERLAERGLEPLTDVVTLLANELVTNAILHARSEIDLVVDCDEQRVRVEVHDASPIDTVLRVYDNETTTGRGLALVEAFSRRWGVEPTGLGKAVWFEVPTAV
jgi:anti-sigma regulatory factor (Ser/Thr protein kinase)